MFTIIMCLLIACLLPVLVRIPVLVAMKNQPGGYDNKHPREQQASLRDFGARAVAGHQNSFEALILFTAASLTALATGTTTNFIQGLAIFWVISRLAYHFFYLYNLSTPRSIVWALGYVTCLVMIGYCLP
jgi:uncharacterized MAPEG superfamily protein